MLPYQSLPNIKRSNFLPPFSSSIIHLLPHVEKTSWKKQMNGRKLRNPKFRRETVRLNNKTKKLRNMKKKNCPSLNCIFFSILISMCSHLLQLCSHGSRLSNKKIASTSKPEQKSDQITNLPSILAHPVRGSSHPRRRLPYSLPSRDPSRSPWTGSGGSFLQFNGFCP